MRTFRKAWAALAFMVLVAIVAGTGIAIAAIPNPDGTIQSCFITHSNPMENQGEVRLVSDPANCKTSETAISWNQQGPTGPTGPAGPTGSVGPQGPQGPAGTDGIFGFEIVTAECTDVSGGSLPCSNLPLAPGGGHAATATCPAGKKAIAGGYETDVLTTMGLNRPTEDGTGWTGQAFTLQSTGTFAWTLTIFAVCASVN